MGGGQWLDGVGFLVASGGWFVVAVLGAGVSGVVCVSRACGGWWACVLRGREFVKREKSLVREVSRAGSMQALSSGLSPKCVNVCV